MRHFVTSAIFVLSTSSAFAGDANFAECVLSRMPGVQSDVAAQAVAQLCLKSHPDGIDGVAWGTGRGLFGYDSGAACTVAKASDTRSALAASMISASCRRLYDKATVTFEEAYSLPPAKK